jgi:hypothetical protein
VGVTDGEGDAAEVDGLIRASGLVLSDGEREALARLYARFARDRAALSRVPLGETEPAVTFNPGTDVGSAG